MNRERLTPDRIRRLTLPEGAGQFFLWDTDAPRLAVRVTAGAKSFIFESKLNRQTIRVTIGDVRAWTLDAARDEARRLQVLIDRVSTRGREARARSRSRPPDRRGRSQSRRAGGRSRSRQARAGEAPALHPAHTLRGVLRPSPGPRQAKRTASPLYPQGSCFRGAPRHCRNAGPRRYSAASGRDGAPDARGRTGARRRSLAQLPERRIHRRQEGAIRCESARCPDSVRDRAQPGGLNSQPLPCALAIGRYQPTNCAPISPHLATTSPTKRYCWPCWPGGNAWRNCCAPRRATMTRTRKRCACGMAKAGEHHRVSTATTGAASRCTGGTH
jgi:hypothetical protein